MVLSQVALDTELSAGTESQNNGADTGPGAERKSNTTTTGLADARLPAGGLPAGGLPAGGLPVGGLPAGGLPAGGLADARLPVAGLPAGGLPAGGLPAVWCSVYV